RQATAHLPGRVRGRPAGGEVGRAGHGPGAARPGGYLVGAGRDVGAGQHAHGVADVGRRGGIAGEGDDGRGDRRGDGAVVDVDLHVGLLAAVRAGCLHAAGRRGGSDRQIAARRQRRGRILLPVRASGGGGDVHAPAVDRRSYRRRRGRHVDGLVAAA